MVEGFGDLNGAGNQQVWTKNVRISQAANHSTFYYEVRYYGNGYGSFGNSGAWSFTANWGGTPFFYKDGTWAIPSGDAYKQYTVLSSGYYDVEHDGAGNLGAFNVRGAIDYNHSNIGKGEVILTEPASPRLPKVPGKPPTPVFQSATATTINYSFRHPDDDGGSGITEYRHQWTTDPNWGSAGATWVDNDGSGQATGLTPGTMHYIRFAAVNAVGQGPFSDAFGQVTLPAVPPGLTVASSPSGTSATLTFSPPGGVSGVTKYTYERRATGTSTPVTSKDSATVVTTEAGLSPGSSYDWRASAWIGGYQSPWTAWTTLVQAKPNVNPGDYFDGATPDVADLNYQWGADGLGAPNASISTALASGVAGWEVDVSGSGGVAVLYRITAGILSSTYAARVQVTADATGAGLRAGQQKIDPYWSAVTIGGSYVGSIHVRPSRSQNLAAEISWLTAGGALVSRTVGAATLVPGGTWLRLTAGGAAPDTAVHAVVRVIDVTGTGWSTWKGGDTLELDGAMISLSEVFPYFDGATLPDGTYIYEWVDPEKPNASISKRTVGTQASPATLSVLGINPRAIIDPNCKPPAPPRPPTIPNDCIVEAGIWRRSFAEIPADQISDWLSVVPTFEIITLSYEVAQARIRIYPNPTGGPVEAVDPTSWISEQIISYIPKNTVLTIDGVHQRVWAEVAGGEAVSADHLLYGSGGKPATWPVLSCGIEYALSVDLPVEILQGDSKIHTYLTTRY